MLLQSSCLYCSQFLIVPYSMVAEHPQSKTLSLACPHPSTAASADVTADSATATSAATAKLKALWARVRPQQQQRRQPEDPENGFGSSPPELGLDCLDQEEMATLSARMDPLDEIAVVVGGHKRSICEVPENEAIRDLSSSSATTTDSAVSSTGDPNSRRSSSGAGMFGDMRPRRSTINSRVSHIFYFKKKHKNYFFKIIFSFPDACDKTKADEDGGTRSGRNLMA